MKKIGIVTYYYKSMNYGGNLQAYALTKILNLQGFSAEQICFDYANKDQKIDTIENNKEKPTKEFHILSPIECARKIKYFLLNDTKTISVNFANRLLRKRFLCRIDAIDCFNRDKIPHSTKVYSADNIHECINDYDVFITGSDMVWVWYCEPFFLSFVPDSKVKIAYAASMGRNTLDGDSKEFFKNRLKRYKAISVRDENGVDLLKEISPVPVQYLLDPTLLLSREQWDELCAERIIKSKYIFCYFLDDNQEVKMLAKEYAKQRRLKLITIADYKDCINSFIKNDHKMGKSMYDVSPEYFISLIKYSESVFTDSFHGMVFSLVYKKQFFVFNREDKPSLLVRIKGLSDIFQCNNRLCDDENKRTIEYLLSQKDISFDGMPTRFIKMKEDSISFLKNNI